MSKCNDHWCEHYGKSGGKCGHCEKKENIRDKPDLRVILKRRQVEQMGLAESMGKKQNKGQRR